VSDFDIIGLFLSFVLFAEGAAEFCQIASFKEMEETFDLTGATVVFAKIPISRKSKVEYKLLFLLFSFSSFLFFSFLLFFFLFFSFLKQNRVAEDTYLPPRTIQIKLFFFFFGCDLIRLDFGVTKQLLVCL
jgi:hypothetical protein